MEFKDRFKGLRIEKQLAVSEVATYFRKTEGAIRSWELGKTKPNSDTLIKVAGCFGCSTDFLLGLSDTEQYRPSEKDLLIKELKNRVEKLEIAMNRIGKLTDIILK